jgi:surface protein
MVNFELSFIEQANSLDKSNNKMTILVYRNNEEGLNCPKCGERIKFDTKIIDKLLEFNNDINDTLEGLKGNIENIINDIMNQKSNNYIKNQLKNVNIVINNIISEIKKNKLEVNKLNDLNKTQIEEFKKNKIKGILDIKNDEIIKSIPLFITDNIDGIDVYLNNNKIKMIKKEDNQYFIDYNFPKEGKYKFEIIFNKPVVNLNRFFRDCVNLYSIDLSEFDSSSVINMRVMFSKCRRLKEIKGLDKFNTSKATNMEGMFQRCEEIVNLNLSNFDTSNVNDMSCMFNGCIKLKEIKGLNKFNTKNVDNMEAMFQYCENLEYLDLSFDTSKVYEMSYMFCKCYKLKKIKGLNKFKTMKVCNMNSMFKKCDSLENIDLSNFDTSNVENMFLMFYGCHKLKEIIGLDKLNTSNVTNMNGMFQDCENLEKLDLSNFDVSNVADMREMFSGCNNLKYLNIKKFIKNDITKDMFSSIKRDKCQVITDNDYFTNLFFSEN